MFLERMWREEVTNINMEMVRDKSKVGKEKFRLFQNLDESLSREFLKKYLERCKFKYVLAFM
jgi:hypothetical protein